MAKENMLRVMMTDADLDTLRAVAKAMGSGDNLSATTRALIRQAAMDMGILKSGHVAKALTPDAAAFVESVFRELAKAGRKAGGTPTPSESGETWALETLQRAQKSGSLPSASERKRLEAVLRGSAEYAEASRFADTRGPADLAKVAQKFMRRAESEQVGTVLFPASEPGTDGLVASSLKSQQDAEEAKRKRMETAWSEQGKVLGGIFQK